jgi:16S rRNA (guanine527-N7)-methyltransferase
MVTRRDPSGTPSVAEFRDRLVGSARGLGRPLSGAQADALATHYRLLLEWGGKMNLTGLHEARAILERHFLEPIAAADLLEDGGRLLDLGSGNGFPAVPLKILRPGIDLVLVEASEKKSAFLWAVLRELGMKGSRVETRRVGTRADLDDLLPCRYLTLRAVRARALLRGEGRPLLEPGGRGLFFLSRADAEAIRTEPIHGLSWAGCRDLPSGARSVVAILEPRI